MHDFAKIEEEMHKQEKQLFPKSRIYSEYYTLREKVFKVYIEKQPDMRVTYKTANFFTKWKVYRGQKCNLREILKDEIVIEFDTADKNKAWKGINFTAINLLKAGFEFEIWEHGGKSPHLHIKDLPIKHLTKSERKEFKKFFIKKYVPGEYIDVVDFSLCGVHMIALEWCEHWKGCYGIKKLLHKFIPEDIKQLQEPIK